MMRGLTAVVRRDVFRRRHLFVIAAALALIATAMPVLPGLAGYPDAEIRAVSACVLAGLLGLVVAVGLGVGLAGRDLSEGRLGFDFARPVSVVGIWGGRLLATLVVLLGCELIVLLPALPGELASSTRQLDSSSDVGLFALAFLLLPVLGMLLVHSVGLMVRARTPWVVIDAAAAVGSLVAVWLTMRLFIAEVQIYPGIAIGMLLLAGLAISLVVASAIQFANGRADLADAHRWSSTGLWAGVILSISAVGACAAWVQDISPSDLDERHVVSASPAGEWIELWGTVGNRLGISGRFLVATSDGRRLRLAGRQTRWHRWLRFSQDGSRAVVGREVGDTVDIGAVDLTANAPVWRSLALAMPTDGTTFWVSPEGSAVLTWQRRTLALFDLDTGDQLGAARDPFDRWLQSLVFIAEHEVRVAGLRRHSDRPDTVAVFDVSLTTGDTRSVGELHVADARRAVLSSDATQITVVSDQGSRRRTARFDLPEFEVVSTIDLAQGQRARTLDDGRQLITTWTDPGYRIDIRDRDGAPSSTHEVDADRELRFGPEVLPGRLLVATGLRSSTDDGCVSTLDVADGSLELIGCDLYPIVAQWSSYDALGPQRDGPPRLVMKRGNGAIVTWSAADRELRPVPGLGGGS